MLTYAVCILCLFYVCIESYFLLKTHNRISLQHEKWWCYLFIGDRAYNFWEGAGFYRRARIYQIIIFYMDFSSNFTEFLVEIWVFIFCIFYVERSCVPLLINFVSKFNLFMVSFGLWVSTDTQHFQLHRDLMGEKKEIQWIYRWNPRPWIVIRKN